MLCLLAAGCGGRNDPYAPIDDAVCAWTVKCRGGTSDDEAACRAASAELRAGAAYGPGDAIASGRAELDGAARDACVASIRAADCTAVPWARCLFVVRGKVRPGGACQDDIDCDGGTCARNGQFPIRGCAGVCVAYPKRGEPCTDRCAPEDYCDDSAHVCMARKPAGAACAGGECELGLQCVGPEGARVCGGPGQPGDGCVGLVTTEAQCASGLYCASQLPGNSGTCAFRVGEGQACTTTPQCQDGLLCVAATDGSATCARPLAEGAACVATPSTGEPGCGVALLCDASSRCVRWPALQGRPCGDNSGCESAFENGAYYCDGATRVCTRRASLGEACVRQQVPSDSCTDGICDADSHRCVLFCE